VPDVLYTLSKSQWRALALLGAERADVMRAWGKGFGITRPTVRVLAHHGLAQYDETVSDGVCCRITAQGRIALAKFQASANFN
jgi:hypothetical protein